MYLSEKIFVKMKKITLLFILISGFAWSQQAKIDSLYKIVKTTKNDSVKVDVYNKIVWKYLFSDKEKAQKLIDTTEKLALEKNQKFGYNSVLGIKGIFYDVNGQPDSAKYFFEKSLNYAQKNNFLIHEQHTLNNLGMYNWNQGNYQEALRFYFESIKINQRIPEKRGSLDANYNNIGLIYQEMDLFEKAIEYHLKALEIREETQNFATQMASYNNLGVCYKELNNFNKSRESFQKSISLSNQSHDKMVYYIAVEGLASVEYAAKNYNKALNLYLQSLNRPAEIPINSKSKVHLFSSLAQVYVKLKQPQKAIEFGENCLAEHEKHNEEFEVEVYKALAEANYMLGDIDKGEYYNTLFYKKTVEKFTEETAESLSEIEVKYKTAEKEKALAQEKVKVAERELKIKNKNIWLILLGFLGVSIGLISLLFINKQRYKNRQLKREKELTEALLKIEHNNKLQEQRLAISRDLHDNIGSQLTFIISSIDSLKMFFANSEEKITDKLTNISQFTRDTIQELRDTIWAMNKDEITVEDFKTRMLNFIEKANVSLQGINFQFKCDLPKKTTFNSKDGMNIYRIIQEAVNNAIKHAKPTEIKVNVVQIENEIQITVEDNGQGFDKEKTELGNGFHSMEKRVAELQADFKIETNKIGTLVFLKFKK